MLTPISTAASNQLIVATDNQQEKTSTVNRDIEFRWSEGTSYKPDFPYRIHHALFSDIRRELTYSRLIVVWAIWVDLCQQAQVDPRSLSRVVRHMIETESTNAIARELYGKMNMPYGVRVQLLPTSPGFAAVLGSLHGKGIAYLLLNKRDVLGNKQVVSIDVEVVDGNLEMVFNLA